MFNIYKSNCLNCNTGLSSLEAHKIKKYCNNACRQKHKRREKNPDIGTVGRPKKDKVIIDWGIKEIPNKAYGFIYRIIQKSTCIDYIGKKSFYSEKNGEIKESNWLEYLTSSIKLKRLIQENSKDFEAKIIQYAYSSKQLTYLENQWQIHYDVFSGNSFNKKCYRKK